MEKAIEIIYIYINNKEENMKEKCKDCTSDLFQISLKKLIAFGVVAIPMIIGTTYKVTGLVHVQNQYNQDIDTLKVSFKRFESKIDVLHMNLYQNGQINSPNDLARLEMGLDTSCITLAEVIPPEEQKRMANTETACDTKGFETKILK